MKDLQKQAYIWDASHFNFLSVRDFVFEGASLGHYVTVFFNATSKYFLSALTIF